MVRHDRHRASVLTSPSLGLRSAHQATAPEHNEPIAAEADVDGDPPEDADATQAATQVLDVTRRTAFQLYQGKGTERRGTPVYRNEKVRLPQ